MNEPKEEKPLSALGSQREKDERTWQLKAGSATNLIEITGVAKSRRDTHSRCGERRTADDFIVSHQQIVLKIFIHTEESEGWSQTVQSKGSFQRFSFHFSARVRSTGFRR